MLSRQMDKFSFAVLQKKVVALGRCDVRFAVTELHPPAPISFQNKILFVGPLIFFFQADPYKAPTLLMLLFLKISPNPNSYK